MRIRLRNEDGMGMIELLVAMVVLNVGLFAVIGVFNSATVAIARAGTISAATAVADKQMEIYKSLQNCAIYLTTPGTFPTIGSGSVYQADTKSYTDYYLLKAPVAFFDKNATPASTALGSQQWATSSTSSVLLTNWSGNIDTSCNTTPGVTPPPTATSAVQTVAGPDGVQYPVYTYIIIVQPQSDPSIAEGQPGYYLGKWSKQVTVVVRDPKNTARVLARQTSLFNKITG